MNEIFWSEKIPKVLRCQKCSEKKLKCNFYQQYNKSRKIIFDKNIYGMLKIFLLKVK